MEWPQKREHEFNACQSNCLCGANAWNACVDAFMKVIEVKFGKQGLDYDILTHDGSESHPPVKSKDALVELDEEKLLKSYHDYFGSSVHTKMKGFLKYIYSTFGTRPVMSVGDIKKSLDPIPSTHYPIYKIDGKVYFYMCKDDIAKAIHDALERKQ